MPALPMTVAELDQLELIRRDKRLRLTTHVGLQGYVHTNYDPDGLVAELIRLARIGATAEGLNADSPRATVATAIRSAT